MHVTILGAEATGRMIVADIICGCGAKEEILTTAATLSQHLAALLVAHPQVNRLTVFVREDIGISLDQFSRWMKSEVGNQKSEIRMNSTPDF